MADTVVDADRARRAAAGPLPHPGGGRTRGRFAALQAVGRDDLCLAKVVEPHHDATAICADLGHPAPATGSLWGVWAAQPPGGGPVAARTAAGTAAGWRLDGTKAFCSGASICTHALLTARVAENDTSADDGSTEGCWRLFAIDLAAGRRDGSVRHGDQTWAAAGMSGADTRSVTLAGAVATPVGAPGAYTERIGFWHGAIGVAACWLGGAYGVAGTLLDTARRRELHPHAAAHLGAVAAGLDAAAAMLDRAADASDAGRDPTPDAARRRAEAVRAVVVGVAEDVVTRIGHALGPVPLALDAEHAHRVADLQVFVRQHHAERDLATLGGLVAAGDERW